ncbi:hypothetical protein ACIPSA_45455 [Streptomyces sp. NPDC086549]|uniref:hypothetical protein n=1 Tax=Streptomyces sp. NPDC086549 TaxID=3365752 RepID=UPI003806BF75
MNTVHRRSSKSSARRPPTATYFADAMLLSAGLALAWTAEGWPFRALSGLLLLSGIVWAFQLGFAEKKAWEAGAVPNARRPALLLLYVAAVGVAAGIGVFAF